MQRRAIEDLMALLRDKLAAAEIPAAEMRGYVTPRRLAVIADGIPPRSPTAARSGAGRASARRNRRSTAFCARPGSARSSDCEMRDTGRGEFYFAVIQRPAAPPPRSCPDLIRRDHRVALAEIDALPGGGLALGAAADLGHLPASTARC